MAPPKIDLFNDMNPLTLLSSLWEGPSGVFSGPRDCLVPTGAQAGACRDAHPRRKLPPGSRHGGALNQHPPGTPLSPLNTSLGCRDFSLGIFPLSSRHFLQNSPAACARRLLTVASPDCDLQSPQFP